MEHENQPVVREGESLSKSSAITDEKSDSIETQVQLPAVKAPPQGQRHSHFNRVGDIPPWRRALIFVGLFFGILLSLMDTSIMATAIYTIALDFNSLANAFWAILSYQLAYLGFCVVFARLSDFIGRRVAVISAYVLFIGFSLGCGWSQNINQLIVFRTIQGIGGAGLYSLSIILLIEASTPKLMPMTSALIGATIAMAGVLGPILGGVLTQYATWRWIFWINGPIGLFAVVCFAIGWPRKITGYDVKRKFREFDWIGAFLILAASVLVVFGLQEAGTGQYAWSSSLVLGTLISGCGCWVLLLSYEYYIHLRHRNTVASMLPFSILTNRPLLAGITATMLVGFSYFLIIISLPLRFQIVNLRTPASAGVHLLPMLCFVGVGGTLGGTLSRQRNMVWQTFTVAGSLFLLGIGLLSTLGSGEVIQAKCYGFQIITGLGVGMTFSAISVMTAVEADQDSHSVAQGIAAQIRVFGGSIGIAASNAIFNATCATRLIRILTPEQIRSLQTNTRIVTTLDGAAKEAVRLAYAQSFNRSLRICVYVASVGLVACMLTWQRNPPVVPAQRAQQMKAAAMAKAQSANKNVDVDVEAAQGKS